MPSRLPFALLLLALPLLQSCGVKLPPVAPQRDEGPPSLSQNFDCSPQDENCDKTDPNYQPKKR